MSVSPKESKSRNEENTQKKAHYSENDENPSKSRHVEEGKRKDEVVNIHGDKNTGKHKLWRSGRRDGFKAFVYVVERAPNEETKKHHESTDDGGRGGERSKLRNDFVASVFLRVSVMFALTIAITGGILFTDLRLMFMNLQVLFLVFMIMMLLITVQCCMVGSEFARRGPCSYALLLVTVVGWSVVCGFFCLNYKLSVIFYALIATYICVTICYLLALTSFDFTNWLLYVAVIVMAIIVASMFLVAIMAITGESMKLFQVILLFASTVLTMIILVIELQMILGGRAVALDEKDFNLGALLLYTSIVSLFLRFLGIIGFIDNS